MSKKVISIILAMCIMLSCLAVGVFTSEAVTTETESVSASTEPQDKIQGSAVLHCFNWSYNNIKANLQAIKDAGYTAVQTSPVQQPKDYSASWTDQSGQWWKLYQPVSISIAEGNTWLGTKAELKSLCDAAEDMGIKVIVDIVANHLGNVSDGEGNKMSNISSQVDASIRNNSNYWHINSDWANDDNNRYTMTVGSIGLPDLNTGNSDIQNMYKQLLIDCINQGVDGFRFDAAKHIELPTDSSNSSQFWPTVINGSQASTSNEIYYYGEILNGCATSISNYTKYMSITDNYSSDSILVAANSSNASGLANSYYSKGAGADKSVLWVESHDTYMGESGSAGIKNTASVSNSTIIKAWAMVGSRANASSLFFARPATTMGSASSNTTWKSTAVAEVNKFKNYFDGQSEYLASSGSIAYNERGTSGVVLVNAGGTSTSVKVPANKMASGTYTDQITGGTFTVSNGYISGNIGSTGVAVVYNNEVTPSATVTPGSSVYKTDTLSLTLNYENATSGQYSIDGGSYKSFTDGDVITIGSGVAYGSQTTVSVKATDGTTTSEAVTYTYTKVDPSIVQKVYFDNSSYGWSNVYVYIYDGATGESLADWPGTKMTLDSSTGYYVLEVPDEFTKGLVMFTESYSTTTNRYPYDGEDGMPLDSRTMIMRANHVWEEYTEQETTTTVATEPTTEVVSGVLIGDTTGDGTINVSDATEIQKYLVELASLTGDNLTAADVDRNGNVDIKDATYIQMYLAGINRDASHCGKYTSDVEPTTQPTTQPVTEPTTAEPTTEPTEPSSYTVTFTNSRYWSGSIYCYYWSKYDTTLSTWPGVKMTSAGTNSYGQSLYTVEVPSEAEYIIFDNNSGSQTVNITFDGSELCYYAKSTTDASGHYEVGTW